MLDNIEVGAIQLRIVVTRSPSLAVNTPAGQPLIPPSTAAAAAFAAADAAAGSADAGTSGKKVDGWCSAEPGRIVAPAVPSGDVMQQMARRWQQQARLQAERWTEEQMAYKPEAWLGDTEPIDAVAQAALDLQSLTNQQGPVAAARARQLEQARRQQRQALAGPGFPQPAKMAKKAARAAQPKTSSRHQRGEAGAPQGMPVPAQPPSGGQPASLAQQPKAVQAARVPPMRVQSVPASAASALQQAPQQVPQASLQALLMQLKAMQAAVAAAQPVQAGPASQPQASQQAPAPAGLLHQPPAQPPAQLLGFPLLPQQGAAQPVNGALLPPALAASVLLGQNVPAYLALLQRQMQVLNVAQQRQQQGGPPALQVVPMPMFGPLAFGPPAAMPQQQAAAQAVAQAAPGRAGQQAAAQPQQQQPTAQGAASQQAPSQSSQE